MKRLLTTMAAIAVTVATASTAFAACISGSIWTNKPGWFGWGYYCTAAENKSTGVGDTWSKAKTFFNNTYTYSRTAGTDRAVASSGSVKPKKGNGSYGHIGSNGGDVRDVYISFPESAWN